MLHSRLTPFATRGLQALALSLLFSASLLPTAALARIPVPGTPDAQTVTKQSSATTATSSTATKAVKKTPAKAKAKAKTKTSKKHKHKHAAAQAPVEAEGTSLGTGTASYYHSNLRGRETASGSHYEPAELTAAHRTLPFGSRVRLTNLRNGKSVTVTITDRGPFCTKRVIDVSYAAAKQLGMVHQGMVKVKLVLLN